MPAHFLLDTNIASYIIKGSFPHVRERLVKVPISEVGISVITEAELRFGVASCTAVRFIPFLECFATIATRIVRRLP